MVTSPPKTPVVAGNAPPPLVLPQPVALTQAPSMRTRFPYKQYKGTPREDPDGWLEDFEGTARANGEYEVRTMILSGVLRGEARSWFESQPEAVRTDWERFKEEFIQEFRRIGGHADAFTEMATDFMREGDTVRSFLQRLRRLAKKATTVVTDDMMRICFVQGLPGQLGIHVRQANPKTLDEAVLLARNYRVAEAVGEQLEKRARSQATQRHLAMTPTRTNPQKKSANIITAPPVGRLKGVLQEQRTLQRMPIQGP